MNWIKDKLFWIVAGIALTLGVFIYVNHKPDAIPPQVGQVPVEVKPPIPRGSDEIRVKPDAGVAGKTVVTIRDTVTVEDTVGTVHIHTVEIYTPTTPTQPPVVFSDTPVQVTFTPVRDPWIVLRLEPMLGITTDIKTISPCASMSVVTLWQDFRLGVAIDRYGVGPLASFEVWREFNLSTHCILAGDNPRTFQLGILYRF